MQACEVEIDVVRMVVAITLGRPIFLKKVDDTGDISMLDDVSQVSHSIFKFPYGSLLQEHLLSPG